MHMDYSRFRIEAVVDWVELDVRTLTPTQGKHLKVAGAGLFSHAHGLNPQTGEKYPESHKNTTTTRFAIRVQAPERFAAITSALAAQRDRLDPSFTIAVFGIEVALDAYAKKGVIVTHEELAEMTSHFLKGINRVSPDHPRIYRRNNETRAIGSHQELIQALMDGFQIGIGSGDGTRFQHGYLKTTDDRQDLPADQHRARVEIRLKGNACPALTLEDLAGFNFADLSDYFRFRLFGEPQTDLEHLMAERQICLGNVIGEDGGLTVINRKGGGTRRNKRGTKASPLNDIARSALRNLSRRWSNSAPGGIRIKKKAIACGNMGNLPACERAINSNVDRESCDQPALVESQFFRTRSGDDCSENALANNRPLNTSYPPHLTNPIKVVSGITPHADLLPILHDLHHADYPPLPDLTINQDAT